MACRIPAHARWLPAEMGEHLVKHGDGVKDVAFEVEDCDFIVQVGSAHRMQQGPRNGEFWRGIGAATSGGGGPWGCVPPGSGRCGRMGALPLPRKPRSAEPWW